MKKLVCLVMLVLLLGACTPPPPGGETITVYFLDENMFAVGTEPYEKAVSRIISVEETKVEAVLEQLFLGPTEEEQAQGLRVVLSGATGYSKLEFKNNGAHLTLSGECNSGGSTYTIANLIFANLKQFPAINFVKIYDQNGETGTPEGKSDSIPFCLEP